MQCEEGGVVESQLPQLAAAGPAHRMSALDHTKIDGDHTQLRRLGAVVESARIGVSQFVEWLASNDPIRRYYESFVRGQGFARPSFVIELSTVRFSRRYSPDAFVKRVLRALPAGAGNRNAGSR